MIPLSGRCLMDIGNWSDGKSNEHHYYRHQKRNDMAAEDEKRMYVRFSGPALEILSALEDAEMVEGCEVIPKWQFLKIKDEQDV